jgi:hypothetical protein
LVILTWVLYGRSVEFEFTNWDDINYIVENPLIQRPDVGAVSRIFVPKSIPGESLYIPLTYLSYWIEVRLFGLSSQVMHAINVLFHCANALLVMLVCGRLTRSRLAAAAAAVVFVMHPLQVESVAWAFGRKDLLATMFALAALWAWLRGGSGIKTSWFWIAATTVLSTMAMLSKPSVLILPALIPVIALYIHGKRGLSSATVAATALSLVAGIGLFFANRSDDFVPADAIPLVERIGLWPYSLTTWLPRLVLLQPPITFYPWPQGYVPLKMALGMVVFFAVLALIAIAIVKRWKIVWFSLLFVSIGFAPTLSTVISYREFITGDRYGYFPLIGIFLLVGVGFATLIESKKKVGLLVAIVASCAMGWGSFLRLSDWRDSISLWSAQTRKMPDHHYGYGGLGKALDGRRKVEGEPSGYELLQKAQRLYHRAVELGTKDPEVFFNMGNNYFFLNRHAEAEAELKRALELSPGYVQAMVNLGRVYIAQKKYADAEAMYLHAANFDSPYGFIIQMNLALVYENMGSIDKALESAKRARSYRPQDPDALQRLKYLSTLVGVKDQKDPKTP